MHKDGVLMIHYIVEENEDLKKNVIDMVKKDVITQWLMGDQLKQDQFNFLYEVIKIIYDSALRDKLIAGDKELINEVIPQLVAFKSIMAIRNIQLTKAKEAFHDKEKEELEAAQAATSKNPKVLKGSKTMSKMNEEEIVQMRMDNEKKGGMEFEKSEQ